MNQTLGRSLLTVTLLLPLLGVLGGCKPEVVPTSGPHQPVLGDQVKIYTKAPAKYEVISKIELPITPQLAWDDKGDANAAFDLLKSKAGSLGANGILFEMPATDYDHLTTAGYHGTFYQVPMKDKPRSALANAIYVIKE